MSGLGAMPGEGRLRVDRTLAGSADHAALTGVIAPDILVRAAEDQREAGWSLGAVGGHRVQVEVVEVRGHVLVDEDHMRWNRWGQKLGEDRQHKPWELLVVLIRELAAKHIVRWDSPVDVLCARKDRLDVE